MSCSHRDSRLNWRLVEDPPGEGFEIKIRASVIPFITPERTHCGNGLGQVWEDGYFSGTSAQGVPVRITHIMLFKTARRSHVCRYPRSDCLLPLKTPFLILRQCIFDSETFRTGREKVGSNFWICASVSWARGL